MRQQQFDERGGFGKMENAVAVFVAVVGVCAVLQQHGGVFGVACLDLVIERRAVVFAAAEMDICAVVDQPLHEGGRGGAHCQ